MPLRRRVVSALIGSAVASGRRETKPPRLAVWVDTLSCCGLDLLDHAVFRAAPLTELFRERISRQDEIGVREVRRGRHDAPEALMLHPRPQFCRSWHGLPMTDRPEAAFTKAAHVSFGLNTWFGMTGDRIWVSCDGQGDAGILGLYINQLSGLDEHGRLPKPTRTGPIPAEDEDILGKLAP